MTQGFVSNYNDSGYTLPSIGESYVYADGSNTTGIGSGILVSGSVNVSGADIYTSGLRSMVGVYKINGNYNDGTMDLDRIFCSAYNLNNSGSSQDNDDAWLVYPGFGIQLFENINYDPTYETYSFISYNVSNSPQIFACGGSSFAGQSNNITLLVYPSSGDFKYPKNTTSSAKIYYRNSQILIPGLTPS